MSLRRTLSKRLLGGATSPDFSSQITTTLEQTPTPPPSKAPARSQFYRDFRASSDFFRRFLQRRAINNHSSPNSLSSFLTLPVGEKLREKLKSLNTSDDHHLRLPPPPSARFGVSVADAKRVLKFAQLEKIREKVRNIPASTIQHGEFVRICSDVCGNREAGLESAKALDESGDVIVLGGVVFLRPDQVAKSMERMISESIGLPNDPRIEELGRLENQKAQIDQKAQTLVRGELYCGLGFLAVQTLGFMRLTFWELSWDVMEPICFFVTSFHFALAYVFFLRTSTEPSFEGYFHRRFKVKQKKLMALHNFDIERYNHLSQAFYPKY
ncbi:calcium uniporter protein 4, mitochondrial [Sesamum indicum]|uniref:Calcium uniporter protein 4, mitochondrial n=1 Tax=Sesamum indicum TaxID=4182 RepID=A0A6I9SV19_SESIN|nr:calcium uniporter protein 4, mitochondrial [Sesamum indicum]